MNFISTYLNTSPDVYQKIILSLGVILILTLFKILLNRISGRRLWMPLPQRKISFWLIPPPAFITWKVPGMVTEDLPVRNRAHLSTLSIIHNHLSQEKRPYEHRRCHSNTQSR